MAPINTTLGGIACNFVLLESDIGSLTYHSPGPPYVIDSGYAALIAAIGFSTKGGDPNDYGTLFEDLFVKDVPGYNFTPPIGKPLLAVAAGRLSGAFTAYPMLVKAVLTMALKGGGLSLQSAAGVADQLTRLNISGSPFNYVQSTLVPTILNAAAAA